MPNWAYNTITAEPKVLRSMKEKYYVLGKDNKYHFDFNQIISEPKTAKECLEKYPECYLKNEKACEDKHISASCPLDNGGYLNWYVFRNKYWGTKWNAVDDGYTEEEFKKYLESNDSIQFDTAWDAPLEVLLKLSKENNDSEILLSYSIEGWWDKSYEKVLNNGAVIKDLSIDSYLCKMFEYDKNTDTAEIAVYEAVPLDEADAWKKVFDVYRDMGAKYLLVDSETLEPVCGVENEKILDIYQRKIPDIVKEYDIAGNEKVYEVATQSYSDIESILKKVNKKDMSKPNHDSIKTNKNFLNSKKTTQVEKTYKKEKKWF